MNVYVERGHRHAGEAWGCQLAEPRRDQEDNCPVSGTLHKVVHLCCSGQQG